MPLKIKLREKKNWKLVDGCRERGMGWMTGTYGTEDGFYQAGLDRVVGPAEDGGDGGGKGGGQLGGGAVALWLA